VSNERISAGPSEARTALMRGSGLPVALVAAGGLVVGLLATGVLVVDSGGPARSVAEISISEESWLAAAWAEEEGLGSAAGVERALERVMRDEDILVGRKRGCKARLFWKKT
jgi:hypothetical protein